MDYVISIIHFSSSQNRLKQIKYQHQLRHVMELQVISHFNQMNDRVIWILLVSWEQMISFLFPQGKVLMALVMAKPLYTLTQTVPEKMNLWILFLTNLDHLDQQICKILKTQPSSTKVILVSDPFPRILDIKGYFLDEAHEGKIAITIVCRKTFDSCQRSNANIICNS